METKEYRIEVRHWLTDKGEGRWGDWGGQSKTSVYDHPSVLPKLRGYVDTMNKIEGSEYRIVQRTVVKTCTDWEVIE